MRAGQTSSRPLTLPVPLQRYHCFLSCPGVRYLLYAAAVLAKFRPVFHRTYKRQLEFLVADVAATGGGEMAKHFPTARQKVRFDGTQLMNPRGLIDARS